MNASQVIWGVIRCRPVLFGVTVIAYILQYSLTMVPVLIARQVLDSLTGSVTFGIEALLLAWICVELSRSMLFAVVVLCEVTYMGAFWSLVRANIFDSLLRRPGAQALPLPSGEVVSRFRDDVNVIQDFMSALYNTLAMGSFTIIAVVIMLNISAVVTLTIFVPMVLVTMLINMARSRVVRFREAAQNATGHVTGLIAEVFNAVQTIQGAGAEGRIISYFNALQRKRRDAVLRDRLMSETLIALARNLSQFGMGAILLLVGQSMLAGDFTVGDFTLFTFYLGWVTDFTAFTGQLLTVYRQLKVSVGRMQVLLSEPEEIVRPRPISPAQLEFPRSKESSVTPFELLEVKGLTYLYPGTAKGIRNVSFVLKRGTFTAITGEVGAGKSTLLRVLLGLLPLHNGEILWNGTLVSDPEQFFAAPRTAYTPQIPHLFSGTLRENILLGMPEPDLQHAVEAAVLMPDLVSMPQALDTVIGSRGVRLSGGQVQRVAAARMILRKPQLLVFDDISSALDSNTERELWSNTLAMPNCTWLAVTHRPQILSRADQILTLKDGILS
jgi:ATP-binding cassette, subfamily B, bacterial